MSLIISVGSYGGFYMNHGRLCLGWIAFTYLPEDIDNIFERLMEQTNDKS